MEQVVNFGGGRLYGKTAAMVESLQRVIGKDVAAGCPPRSIRMSEATAGRILALYGSYAVSSEASAHSFMGLLVTIDNAVQGVVIERSRPAV
ncbi:hypothetical protein [Brevundimonas diminuta]|uniref:hypothetical protein n=1 Tax=Brevundimonas diminuta TaxID=293 RepID=UPI003F7FC0D8